MNQSRLKFINPHFFSHGPEQSNANQIMTDSISTETSKNERKDINSKINEDGATAAIKLSFAEEVPLLDSTLPESRYQIACY